MIFWHNFLKKRRKLQKKDKTKVYKRKMMMLLLNYLLRIFKATNVSNKYDPLSPIKILALGKLKRNKK